MPRLVVGELRSLCGERESVVVLGESFPDFPCEVQSWEPGVFPFEDVNHPEAMAIVLEPAVAAHQPVQSVLPSVAEW